MFLTSMNNSPAEMARGYAEWAVCLLSAVAAMLANVGASMTLIDQPGYENLVAQGRTELSDTTFEEEWSLGEKMSPEQALAFALGNKILNVLFTQTKSNSPT
jgi:hypothetical protein